MKRVCIWALALGCWSAGCNGGPADPVVEHGTAVDHGAAIFQDPEITGTPLNSYSCATCHEARGTDEAIIRTGGSLAGATKRPSFWAGSELDLLRAVNDCLF